MKTKNFAGGVVHRHKQRERRKDEELDQKGITAHIRNKAFLEKVASGDK